MYQTPIAVNNNIPSQSIAVPAAFAATHLSVRVSPCMVMSSHVTPQAPFHLRESQHLFLMLCSAPQGWCTPALWNLGWGNHRVGLINLRISLCISNYLLAIPCRRLTGALWFYPLYQSSPLVMWGIWERLGEGCEEGSDADSFKGLVYSFSSSSACDRL